MAPFGSCHAELLEDFESLKFAASLESPRKTQPVQANRLYSPKRPVSARGYTIGPEAGGGDSGGGDSGGSDCGGGDWGGSDGGGDGGYNFFVLILFGSGVIVIGRVIGDYGYKILASGIEKYLQITQKELDQAGEPAASAGIEPRKRAIAAALVPVLFSGSALAVLSYVLHPERLREIVALLADVIALLVQELGGVLLQLIPPELQELAHRVGAALEFIGGYARQLLEQVVIPVLLYARTFGIWFVSAFFVFKLVTFGVELYQILAASGAFNVHVPPEVQAKAVEIADVIGAITAEDSPALFLIQFSKAISLLVVGLVPVPSVSVLPKSVVKLLHLSAIAGVYGLVLQDTRHISQLASQALQASPEFCSMVSCIAGRWCLIIIIGP
uniref:Uncharacterized protein n=1 Tax=Halimeda minima TaxID=170427 RepID=A0A386AYU5_9CHLO|nr:hypothetical protein [Halimeda minima]